MRNVPQPMIRWLTCPAGPLVAASLLFLLATGCSPSETASTTATEEMVVARGEPIQPLSPAPAPEPTAEPEPTTVPAQPTTTSTPGQSDPLPVASGEPGREIPAPDAGKKAIEAHGRTYDPVGFDQLAAFDFEVSDELLEGKGAAAELTEKANRQIPETVRDLDQKEVALKGYMLPLKVEQGAVTEFLLMRDQSMCCYGTVPKINEWVSVKTLGTGLKPVMDQPITILGRLHVGEIRENGYLVGIYRMDGQGMLGPNPM